MIKLKVDGSEVIYDTLNEAREAAAESGRGIEFWHEALEACVRDEGAWNDLLNDLWQSGGEREAERLNALFGELTRRHWLLVALELCTEDPWTQFLAVWKDCGDHIVDEVVWCTGFMPWLKEVQPDRHALMDRVFGSDSERLRHGYLVRAFLRVGEAEFLDVRFERFVDCVTAAFEDLGQNGRALVDFLEEERVEFLVNPSKETEIGYWRREIRMKALKRRAGTEMSITLPGGVPMTFCWCPATTSEEWKSIAGGNDYFLMGKQYTGISARLVHPDKQHRVKLTMGYWIGKFEVTQRQWRSIMGTNPSGCKGEDRPVERVTWNDCQSFIAKINVSGRSKFSLPTEAQWEYACRAGTVTPFSFGQSLSYDNANYDRTFAKTSPEVKGRYKEKTSQVGSYPPNDWGLFDMHGNVWEWCMDWYGDYGEDVTDPLGPSTGKCRVARGGSWCDWCNNCGSASRSKVLPGRCNYDLGLRLVCLTET